MKYTQDNSLKTLNKFEFINKVTNLERKLYLIAKSKLNNEEDVKDAIQETIYSAYKNIKNLNDTSKFDFWLIKILINNCNAIYKKRKHIHIISYDNDNLSDTILFNNLDEMEQNIDFNILLKLLYEDEKTIFTLYYSDNYGVNDVATILNINENTVKSKLKRAREKVKNYIERWENNE